jgi:hypothetical protein
MQTNRIPKSHVSCETSEATKFHIVVSRKMEYSLGERLRIYCLEFEFDEFLKNVPNDPNEEVDDYGRNALHIFMLPIGSFAKGEVDICNYERVIDKLLERKANINATDRDGKTPLYYAVQNRHDFIIPFLLARGANMRYKPKHRQSILQLALFIENAIPKFPMVTTFMLAGAKPEELIDWSEELTEPMKKFYEGILRTRKVACVLIGARKHSPLLKLIGKDCLILIAKTIYQTRGEPVWDQDETPTVPK